MRTKIKCPYCGIVQPTTLKTDPGPQVKLCDNTDVAGCDKYFVVSIATTRADIEYFTLGSQDG